MGVSISYQVREDTADFYHVGEYAVARPITDGFHTGPNNITSASTATFLCNRIMINLSTDYVAEKQPKHYATAAASMNGYTTTSITGSAATTPKKCRTKADLRKLRNARRH